MPGTIIHSIKDRLAYAGHWQKERDEIKQLIEKSGVEILGPTDLQKWKHIVLFTHHVDEAITESISDAGGSERNGK